MSQTNSFIEKIITLSTTLLPAVKNKEKRIALLTEEKTSAVKNWLFHGALPSEKKKLKVADRLGVSREFLYNNDEQTVTPPITIYDEELSAFIIPKLTESDIYDIAVKSAPVCVLERYILSIKEKIRNELIFFEKTYCFETSELIFPPYVFEGDIVIFNETYTENCTFKLYISKDKIEIVTQTEKNNEVINRLGNALPLGLGVILIPIILIISDGTLRQ